MAGCAITSDTPLVQGLLTSVDCNVAGVVERGYSALIGPGSQFQAIFTILLTLYVAIFGFRIMLGLSTLRFGELTLTAVKLGAVLALATNWPIYQQIVVSVLYDGPQAVAAQILGGPGQSGLAAPYAGLQTAFDEMQVSADYFAQRTPGVASPFVGGAAFGAFALNTSSMTMLLSTLGLVLASKIVLAALLAFGPVFVALFLFEATRGLFVGWLRATIALALTPLFALLALVFQLLLIQPHLMALAQMRAETKIDIVPAIATLALTGITAGVSLAGLIAVGFIASGLKLERFRRQSATSQPAPTPAPTAGRPEIRTAAPVVAAEAQPRAAAIAAAAAGMERRDSRVHIAALETPRYATASTGPAPPMTAYAGPDRQSARRRFKSPRSASSARRDR